MKDHDLIVEFLPIECVTRVGYDAAGQLTFVEVQPFQGGEVVIAHPEPGERIGAVFERAYEGAKTLIITKRVTGVRKPEPSPGNPEPLAGDQPANFDAHT